MIKVKICGVTRASDAQACINANVNAVGLNFAPESKRYIDLEAAQKLVQDVANIHATRWAGVFVNPALELVLEAVAAARLTIVQLHGEEFHHFVSKLKMKLPSSVSVWKAFRVSTADDLAPLKEFDCDAWLLDAKSPSGRGGLGKSFDWNILKALQRTKPLILAGGLNPENVRSAVKAVLPDWVDTASGVESAPGVKDAHRIQRFVQEARRD